MVSNWTVVLPVKPFHLAKSRLGTSLGPLREAFARAFFKDTLSAVLDTAGVAQVLVVTRDLGAAAEARRRGALPVSDTPALGRHEALLTAAVSPTRSGANALSRS